MSTHTRFLIPLPLFASVMGLSGLAMVWRATEIHWGLMHGISQSITILTITVFVLLIAAYITKWFLAPERVLAELNHPVRINFLPAISINFILLGILITPWLPELGLDLWRLGAALQLLLTLIIVNIWLNSERPSASINPAWFIPAVGNVLVPVAAAPAGYPLVSWFFLSIGLFFWAILVTVIFYRLITKPALEPQMRPTLVVMIAPPTVSFLSLTAMTGEMGIGAMALFFIAVFFVLLLIPQIPGFLRLPYFPSWWAYTFPVAAFVVACHRFAHFEGLLSDAMLLALTALATLIIGIVFFRTLLALARGEMAHH